MGSFRLRRPSPALVVATLALVVAMGGTAYAGFSVPSNSVGSKQLKKNAVTTKKLKNGAVTGKKIAKNTITGTNINLSTLGTVPSATHASTADNATNAGTADNIAAPEGMHVIGAPGQPAFQNGCTDATGSTLQPVAFFKDKEGIVHLQGAFKCPASEVVAFQLPAGYQPTSGTFLRESANGGGSGSELLIIGPGVSPSIPGGSVAFGGTTTADTSGDTFRPGA